MPLMSKSAEHFAHSWCARTHGRAVTLRCDVATWRKRPLRPRPAPSSLRPRPRPTPNEQHKWAHRSAHLRCGPTEPAGDRQPEKRNLPHHLVRGPLRGKKSRLRQGERITTHPHAHTSASPTPPHIPSHPPRPLPKRFLTSGPASAGVGRTVSLWLPSERGAARRRPSEAVKTNALSTAGASSFSYRSARFSLILYSCVHMYRYSCMRAGARRIPLEVFVCIPECTTRALDA